MIAVENKIVKNVFTDTEIREIYSHISNTPVDRQHQQKDFSQTVYHSWLPENIVNKITSIASNSFGKKLVLRELSFARYDNSITEPQLFPHYDETFKEQRITLDIQVKSSKHWAIIIEDAPYILSDNEALFFSGTHQVHWREKTTFSDDDYVDMIFCHFAEESAEPISPDHYLKMDALVQKFRDQYYA